VDLFPAYHYLVICLGSSTRPQFKHYRLL